MDSPSLWAVVLVCGSTLVLVIKTLWTMISTFLAKLNLDLDECKDDRTKLFGKVEELNHKYAEVSESLGEMRGRLNMVEK